VKLGPEIWDVSQEFGVRALGETLGRNLRRRAKPSSLAALLAAALGTLGCGYRPIYDGGVGHRYEVVVGGSATASFEAGQAAAAGLRSELGAAQALGHGFPRVVVEVLRVDERSIGVRSTDNGPLARGSEVVVVGRAQIIEVPEGPPGLDTGDMSRAAQFAAGSTPSADAAARSRAVRDAARSLGRALGRAVLGLPEPSEG